ncbi:MAG: pyrrolidone-carboxylate peptidase [Alphaproteobacteria bacterium]|nr:pyrrolidone-carboxylate peptidase [Alphaproteobacteria bacterium]
MSRPRGRPSRGTGRSAPPTILLTGFEPFGGFAKNPSALIVEALDGRRIGPARVVGRILPVDLAGLDEALATAMSGLAPAAVVALGLAASEPVIRLERVALNVADFTTPDNTGAVARNAPLDPAGPDARLSRLPLEAILDDLLAAGIPARLSETAGLYLCNAAMYRLLDRVPAPTPCGFIHLPPLPEQVAAQLRDRDGRPPERGAPLASMDLALQRRAVEIALATTLATTTGRPRKRS